MITVIPAYGRDYKSSKEAIEDWEKGKDFIICDVSNVYDGKAININSKPNDRIKIRYNGNKKFTIVDALEKSNV